MTRNYSKNNAEEEIINVITNITNIKSTLVDFLISEHSKFCNLNIKINELFNRFIQVEKQSLDLINESEKCCQSVFSIADEKEKYTQQIGSLRILLTDVFDMFELNRHVYKLKGIIFEPLKLTNENFQSVSIELFSMRKVLKRTSWTFGKRDVFVYNAILHNFNNFTGDLQEEAEKLWYNNVIYDYYHRNPKIDYESLRQIDIVPPRGKAVSFNLSLQNMQNLMSLMYAVHIGTQHILSLLYFMMEDLIQPVLRNFDHYKLSVDTSTSGPISLSVIEQFDETADEFEHVLTKKELADMALDGLVEILRLVHGQLVPLEHRAHLIHVFDVPLSHDLTEHFLPSILNVGVSMARIHDLNGFLRNCGYLRESNHLISDFLDTREEEESIHYEDRETGLLFNCTNTYKQNLLDFDEHDRVGDAYTDIDELEKNSVVMEYRDMTKFLDLKQLLFQKCNVSSSVSKVMNMVKEMIQYYVEQKDSSLEQVMQFLLVIPEVMNLYQSMLTSSHFKEINEYPKAAALHYNNLTYIAHHCLVISPSIRVLINNHWKRVKESENKYYKVVLINAPQSLLKIVDFMRDASSRALSEECARQMANVEHSLADIDTFMGVSADGGRRAEAAIDRCARLLMSLASAYRVLPAGVCALLLCGRLIDLSLRLLVARVISMTTITAADAAVVLRLLTDFLDRRLPCPTEGDAVVRETCLLETVPAWGRARALTTLLAHSLPQIDDSLAALQPPLSAEEVAAVVKARFSPGPMKAALLARLLPAPASPATA